MNVAFVPGGVRPCAMRSVLLVLECLRCFVFRFEFFRVFSFCVEMSVGMRFGYGQVSLRARLCMLLMSSFSK